MEYESQNVNEETQIVEFEDIDLSDTEENDAKASDIKLDLNIDHNNRIISKETLTDFNGVDNCDMRFQEGTINFLAACATFDDACITSDEELEISEEDISHTNMLTLQYLNLEGVACISVNQQSDTSLNYSSTNFKDEYVTDAEDISDDDNVYDENKGSALLIKKHENLSYGLAVANVISAAKAVSSSISSKQPCTDSLSFIDKYYNIIPGCKNRSLLNHSDVSKHESNQPLMTCVEFLDSEPHEDGGTDTEDFSADSYSSKSDFLTEKVCNVTELSEKMSLNMEMNSVQSRFHSKVINGADLCGKERKGSTIIDLATDDETLCIESENVQMTKRTKKGKLKRIRGENIDFSNEALTDEEFFDIENKG